jgi:hypothetical protein
MDGLPIHLGGIADVPTSISRSLRVLHVPPDAWSDREVIKKGPPNKIST